MGQAAFVLIQLAEAHVPVELGDTNGSYNSWTHLSDGSERDFHVEDL
jgi:hypothetical protein